MKTENFEMITVQREYVLINENENEFAVKSEHELKQCVQSNVNMLCEFEELIEKNTSNICELEIVLNKQENNCITMEYNSKKFLKKIRPSTWLFSINNSIVNIECENVTYSTQLHGSGILELRPKCTAKIEEIKIHGLDYNASNITLSAEKWHTISVNPASSVNTSLNQLKTAVNELKKETKIHQILHVHHTTILYAFVSWMIICICLIKIRRMKREPNITVNN